MENIKRLDLQHCNPQKRMKNFGWLIVCFFVVSTAQAQEKLVAQGKAPALYVKHKVAGGEVLSGIASQYGTTSVQLAKFNGIKVATLLKKGAILKIPLTRNNLAQGQSASFNEPVYHTVAKGDNLFHISQSFNNVNIQLLRDWNGLKRDVIRDGQLLIVGYLKGRKRSEVAAAPAVTESVDAPPATANTTAPVPVTKKNQQPLVTEPKKEPAEVKNEAPQQQQPAPVPAKKEEPKVSANADIKYDPKPGDEGYFALQFANHPETATQQFHSGDAGIFKTISGWTDRKFYVLMNDVPPGTIVRITSTSNKSICAKVLDKLVETKGGTGLLLRMSNAAAVALDMTDGKSTVSVTYFE